MTITNCRKMTFRSSVIIVVLCLLRLTAFSQEEAYRMSRKGDSAYEKKNYPLAIAYYNVLSVLNDDDFSRQNTYYNMACCYALNNEKANAWKYLDMATAAGYNNYAHLLKDSDLDLLHADKKWKKFARLKEERQKKLADPLQAKLVTTDIHNFWAAYDKVQKDTAQAAAIYKTDYFDKATQGLKDYYGLRIYSVQQFVRNQQKKPKFYASIKANTLRTDEFKPQMQASFVKLKAIYPEAVFPDVYFVIGRWNSAGTLSANGLLIGTDMMSKSSAVDAGELSLWEANNFKPIDNLPYIVAHELIHAQQNNMKNDTTTLSYCIREGMADFLAELIAGKSSNDRLLAFGKGREKQIWHDFEKDMYFDRYDNWIANSSQETPDHPADLGYWIGYQVCKSYYDESADKKQAVYDMLHITDYKQFLQKSRCAEKISAL